jgi:hypothetical protein
MKETIKFNKRGLIVEGAYKDWYLLVENDTSNTGGYYVFISNSPNVKGEIGLNDAGEGYDNWFENEEQLNLYFVTNKWVIHWE